MVDRGYREFVVDLENCAMMDSTFMGTMAGVALKLRELGHGHLHVVHCGQRSRELLTGLGLDQIFSIHRDGADAPNCEVLSKSSVEADARRRKRKPRRRQMLDAHEALWRPRPENILAV